MCHQLKFTKLVKERYHVVHDDLGSGGEDDLKVVLDRGV